MAEMYLVTLSEASGNDIGAQKWLLEKMCNRAQSMGKVTLTTMFGSWDDLYNLFITVRRLYDATGGNFQLVDTHLNSKLKEVEAKKFTPDQVEHADKAYREMWYELDREVDEIDKQRGEQLKKDPARAFFKPRR